MKFWRTIAAIALVLIAGTVASVSAQDVTVPAEWAGIWQTNVSVYNCATNELLSTTSSLDTLCTGAPMDFPVDEEITFECTSSVSGATIEVDCTGSADVEGCPVTFTMTSTTTRSGNSYSGTTTMNMVFGFPCNLVPPYCIRMETTGTRIAGEPPTCTGTAAELLPWGALKGIYR